MNGEPQIVEDDHAIACHEAGHLIAARFRGRGIDKVSLDRIDGKRGCFQKPAPDEWTDFDEMLICLAGPRAQVALRPDTLGEKLAAFESRIIQPQDEPRRIPQIYGYTGWQHDVGTVYQLMMMPRAPVDGLTRIVTRTEVLDEVERRVLAFFAVADVVSAGNRIAEWLLEARRVNGSDAESFVASTGILDSAELQALMTWQ